MDAGDPAYRMRSVDWEGDRLAIEWGDGHVSRYHGIWLRHQCECRDCGTPRNAVRGMRILNLADDYSADSITRKDGLVEIVWQQDSHRSVYQAVWLRDHCYEPSEVARRTHQPKLWDGTGKNGLPVFDFEAASADRRVRMDMLQAVSDFGACRIVNAPTEAARAREMIALVGQQRQSHFGTYSLSKKAAVDNVGDVTFELLPHVDETYRLSTIGITVFQVLCPATEGGETTLVDGFEAARILRRDWPEDFDLLCRYPVTGERFDAGHNTDGRARWFVSRLPVLRLDRFGSVCGVRMNERQIAPLEVPPDAVPDFYRALKRLYAVLYDPAMRLTLPLKAGEGVIFNNQRVLHGRNAYERGDPPRSVLTSSVDLEEFYSNLRLLRADLLPHAAPVIYPQGMVQ